MRSEEEILAHVCGVTGRSRQRAEKNGSGEARSAACRQRRGGVMVADNVWDAARRHDETAHGQIGIGSEDVRRSRNCQTQCHALAAVMGHDLEFYGFAPGCFDQDTPTGKSAGKGAPLVVDSTRTSIDSPGLITSVGYILIAGRSAAVFGSNPWCVSSYPGGAVSLKSTLLQPIGRLSGRVNVPSPPDVAVSFA